ncbi:hypothetical protein E0W68_07405 [Flavobacterium salilacus subsp. salilacus]|uniref:hypothetical protein n=1 Tax=Flavobacterium TaxID=237 RepID=UPI00107541E9|nr:MULTISPECIES: hypothetical protein [Flavobacterium]KAF2518577.1 hypothetical protein E0W68_07405 [Flavobacterium salilacus subsp. salilacus]MBE1613533.1 hypothetical protein [Flavobacterium sp. SaA2.13]
MKNFKLDNEPKINSGFKAPDDYFSTLTDIVLQKLPQQETKVIPLYRKKPVWLSAAAIFMILIGGSLFFKLNTTTAQPDSTAIENYLVYQSSISEYDLYQKLDADDIAELEQSIGVSNEAIEDYISTQNNYDIYLTE